MAKREKAANPREALRRASKQQMTEVDFRDRIFGDDTHHHDRGIAILSAIDLELSLTECLLSHLCVGPELVEHLYGDGGPLGTFDRKIKLGFAMGIYGREIQDNLTLIRDIRNAFAHAVRPLKFETEEVMNACAKLNLQQASDWKGMQRYIAACVQTQLALSRYGLETTKLVAQLFSGPAGPDVQRLLRRSDRLP